MFHLFPHHKHPRYTSTQPPAVGPPPEIQSDRLFGLMTHGTYHAHNGCISSLYFPGFRAAKLCKCRICENYV